jgi:hypothetical protein
MCLVCSDTIISQHRHDYKSCSCGNVQVDGGSDYAKYGYLVARWIAIPDKDGKFVLMVGGGEPVIAKQDEYAVQLVRENLSRRRKYFNKIDQLKKKLLKLAKNEEFTPIAENLLSIIDKT